MKKLLFLLLLFPCVARAQFTTVTATVTDPNGIPYAGGTMSAVLVPGASGGYTLNGAPYSGRVGPFTLDSTGSFTANFGDVTLITPGSPQWQITIDSNPGGILAPLGTGSQTFTFTSTGTTISGSSPVSLTTALNALAPKLTNFVTAGTAAISAATTRVIYAADPQWAGGVKGDTRYSCVAGISSGSKTVLTDQGTSTITNTSLTSNVATITSVHQFHVGDVIASITGSTNGGGAFNVTNVVVTSIVAGVSFNFSLVHANIGSAADTGTVQGPSVDTPFVNATIAAGGDIGDVIFGTNMPCSDENGFDFPANTNILPIGTITAVNSPTSVQASIAATGTCTGNLNTHTSCQVAWARHDDTAALQAAFNASIAQANGQDFCGALVLPVGNFFVSSPITNTTSRCGVDVGLEAATSISGFAVVGQGSSQSQIIPSPSLDASTAMPSGAGAVIFFGTSQFQGTYFANFGINGIGNDVITNGNGKCMLSQGNSATSENINIVNWGNIDTSTVIGLCSAGAIGGATYVNNYDNANGGGFCAIFAAYTNVNAVSCLTILGVEMYQGDVFTENSYFSAGKNRASAVKVFSNGIWNSSNDFIQIPGGNAWCVQDSGIIYWTNMHCWGGGNSGNGGGIWLDGTSSTLGIAHVSNSVIQTSATGGPVITANGSASGTYYDGCNNSFATLGSSYVVTPTNISFYGSCSVTGSPLVTGNIVLSANWGSTRAAQAFAGATSTVSFTITNGAATVGASPTITYTFPTPFYTAPLWCNATDAGGTNPIGTFTSSSLTATGVTFTFSLTPTVNDTELVQVQCATQ